MRLVNTYNNERKIYRTANPAMLYGKLIWMCVNTRRNRIRNEKINELVGVAPIEDKFERKLNEGGLVTCNGDQ